MPSCGSSWPWLWAPPMPAGADVKEGGGRGLVHINFSPRNTQYFQLKDYISQIWFVDI